MKCNVGGADKILRIIIGGAALAAAIFLFAAPLWKIAAFVVAAIAIGTALISYCPLNALIGLNTCKGGQ
jgi:type IV secretory pathway TrbD component